MSSALAIFIGDRVVNYFANGERTFVPEINKNYNIHDLVQRLERASGGDYKGYYDIDRHSEKFVFSNTDDMIVPYTIPYLVHGNTQLTLENGDPIPLSEGDWLVPVLIRKEERENNWKENIHLLLPSRLVGDLKQGDSLALKYKNTVFNITITDADPQYQDNPHLKDQSFALQVLHAESQLYPQSTPEAEANGYYRRPSLLRMEERMKARLAEIPSIINTINTNRDSTYIFNQTRQTFVPLVKSYKLPFEAIKSNTQHVEYRAPDLANPLLASRDIQPNVGPKGFGLYCYTDTAQVVMTVAKDKLILWQHNTMQDYPASMPKILRDKIKSDILTVIPLNNGTISADQIKENVDNIQAYQNMILTLNVRD